MFIPNQFVSSTALRQREYDPEGRLREFRITGGRDSDDGGIAAANSLYATDAEFFGSMAPFLRCNKARDARRRNYIIQPGGAAIVFNGPAPAVPPSPLRALMPSEQESFGHNSYDGTKFGGGGAVFNVSDAGPMGRGGAR